MSTPNTTILTAYPHSKPSLAGRSLYRCVFYGDLYPNQECYEQPVSDGLKRLMEVRKKFAYGERTDYFHHANCIGFVRKGNAAGPGCAVLVSNAEPKE